MNLLKSSLSVFITKVFLFALGIISSVIIVRLIGAEGKGILSVIQTFFIMVVALSFFSLNSGLVFYESKNDGSNSYISSALLYSFFQSVVVVLFLFIFQNIIKDTFFSSIEYLYIYIGFILVFANSLLKVSKPLTMARRNSKTFNFALILQHTTYFLIILILWLSDIEVEPYHIVVSLIIVKFVNFFYVFSKYKKDIVLRNARFSEIKKMFVFGFKEHVGVVSKELNLRLDILVMSALLSTTEIGYYAIGVGFAQLVWWIPDSIGTFLYPKISKSTDNDSSAQKTANINRITLSTIFIVSVFLFISSDFVLPLLYGEEFVRSVIIVKILLFGTVGLSLQKILTKYFSGIGKPFLTSTTTIVGLIITIPLLYLLIPSYGIIGAAIATTASYGIMAVFVIYLFTSQTKISLIDLLILKKEDLALLKNKIRSF